MTISSLHLANCPNSILGIFYYLIMYWLGRHWSCGKAATLTYYMALTSLFPTFWLAYVLMYILNDICVVCITTYFCNFALIYLNNKRQYVANAKKTKSD